MISVGRFVLYTLSAAATLCLCVTGIVYRIFLPSVLFGIVSLASFYEIYEYGCILEFSTEGIRKRFFRFVIEDVPWEALPEAGVLDIRVRPGFRRGKRVPQYIYFSRKAMTDDDRYRMAAMWAPKGILYTTYSPDKMQQIEKVCPISFIRYNLD